MSDVETRIFVFPPTRPTIWGALSVLVFVRAAARTHTHGVLAPQKRCSGRTHTHPRDGCVAFRFVLLRAALSYAHSRFCDEDVFSCFMDFC
jgi:hypothetical protein